MEYVEFWERTNKLIKEQNTTQKALSLKCGFTERRIESLSSENRSPSVDESVKIAAALHTSVEYLVTGTEHIPHADTSKLIAALNTAMDEARKL